MEVFPGLQACFTSNFGFFGRVGFPFILAEDLRTMHGITSEGIIISQTKEYEMSKDIHDLRR